MIFFFLNIKVLGAGSVKMLDIRVTLSPQHKLKSTRPSPATAMSQAMLWHMGRGEDHISRIDWDLRAPEW